MLLGQNLFDRQRLALFHLGQLGAVFVVLVVPPFLIHSEEAVEEHDAAGSAQDGLVVGRYRIDSGPLHLGAFHLAGDGAFPDQVVEPGLIGIELLGNAIRRAPEAGRADGFMGFLCVLGLARIGTRHARQIARAVALADGMARIGNAFARHLHAIGSHISNEADGFAADIDAFIKLLRDLHGALGVEAELA